MAEITKIAAPSLTSITPPPSNQFTGGDNGVLVAGEALAAFDNVYIKNDGTVWRSNGTAANAAANVVGQVPKAFASGARNVTVYLGGITVLYGTGLTPGARYFQSAATPGGLSDTATTGGTTVVAFAVDTQRVRFLPPH